jgi:hypothetical protein
MNTNINNPQAFPSQMGDMGMTLRDYFAGQALIAVMCAVPRLDYTPDTEAMEHLAKNCYKYADAMIAEKHRREGKGKMSGEKMDREVISAEIHKCYCRAYERRFGKPYWTNGDYSKLDEATKDYDRAMADWHIKQMYTRTPTSGVKEVATAYDNQPKRIKTD